MSASPTTTPSIPAMGLAQMRRSPSHPGAILADLLRDGQTTKVEAATRLGMTKQALNAICSGIRPMSPALCVKVGALFSQSPEFWGNLQMRYDLWHAMHDPAVAKQVKAIAPIGQVA